MNTIEVRQDGLNALIEKKIAGAVERGLGTAQEAVKRLIDEGAMSHDYIAPIGTKTKNSESNGTKPEITFGANGHVLLQMEKKEKVFTLNTNAVSQLAGFLGINPPYLRSLNDSEWGRKLSAIILNEHSLNTEKNRVLIRSVGTEVRGVLSDSYRRLNSATIVQAFLKEALDVQGALLLNGHMGDTRLYIETIHPKPVEIPTKNNGTVLIAFGSRISSSDYGDGALQLRTFYMQGACLNGMARESLLRQIHLGGKLPEDIQLSDKTYRLDTETTASAVTDITKKIFSPDNIRMKALEIQGASEMEVDIDRELKALRKKELREDEIVEIGKVLMNNNPEDGIQGTNSLWKLVQGITATARIAQPQRMREMHEIAGELMDRVKVSA